MAMTRVTQRLFVVVHCSSTQTLKACPSRLVEKDRFNRGYFLNEYLARFDRKDMPQRSSRSCTDNIGTDDSQSRGDFQKDYLKSRPKNNKRFPLFELLQSVIGKEI